MLNRLHVLTIEAINGAEAVSIVKSYLYGETEYDIQLILMDLQMPIMDGVEATIEIRKLERLNKRSQKIPIVAVTAHSSTNDKNDCLKAGMQEHVVKPVTNKVLREILGNYALNLLQKPKVNIS